MTDATAPLTAQIDATDIKSKLVSFFIASAAALLAFDIFGQVLSPMFGFATLAPVGLANATIKAVFGAGFKPGAEALHYFAGLFAYAFGWVAIAEPLRRKIWPSFPWLVSAILYGIVLWAFALYVMAHLVTGNKPFLGWTGITWVAFWGHILYGVVIAWVWRARTHVS